MGRVPKVGSNMCDIINVVNLESDWWFSNIYFIWII